MAQYLSCQNATQRTRIIQQAKYPAKRQVSAYQEVRKPLTDALFKSGFGHDDLDFLADRLADKVRRESGQAQNNARLAGLALEAFRATFNSKRLRSVTLSPASGKLLLEVSGVKLNVSLDAMVTAKAGEIQNSGGLVLIYAFGADRSDIRDRQATISSLILWALEGGQVEPLPRLCMAVDLHDQDIVKATPSHSRFRDRVSYSCAEVAARWENVEPPNGYDGPDP